MESSDFSKRGRNNGLSVMFRIKISSYLNRRINMANNAKVGLTPYVKFKEVLERELPDLINSDDCSNYFVAGSNQYVGNLWIRNCGTIIVPQTPNSSNVSDRDPAGWFNEEISKLRRIQSCLNDRLRIDPTRCVDHDLETLNLISANTVYDIEVGKGRLVFDVHGTEETVLKQDLFDRVYVAFYDKTWGPTSVEKEKEKRRSH
jgi:hypothetical protein